MLASNTQNVSMSQTMDVQASGNAVTELLNSGGSLKSDGAKSTVSLEGLGSLAVVVQ